MSTEARPESPEQTTRTGAEKGGTGMPQTERHRCVDCGALSPEAETSFALIRQAGWRLTRPVDREGRPSAQWRCGGCWSSFKEKEKQREAREAEAKEKERRARPAS